MSKIIFLFTTLFSLHSFSQTITMDFPAFAGKTYDFVIFQGSIIETVIQDTIPKNGKFKLTIPIKNAPYTGMCRWLITGTSEGGGIDMAIPGHDFSVTCLSSNPDSNNIIYNGFDAVNELNKLNSMQQSILDKFEIMSKATELYDDKHPLFKAFQKEKIIQIQAFDQFQKELKKNSNYNARFLPIVNLVNGTPTKLTNDYEQRAKYVNEYIVNELNFDHLYTSGHWTGIIQSWVQMRTQMYNNKEGFANDFNLISKRIIEPKKYTDFVGKVTYFLTQFGKDDFIEVIASTVVNSGKITSYEGKTMQVYATAMIGSKAPNLIIIEHLGNPSEHNHKTTTINTEALKSKYSLLLFYQSGCGPCEETMRVLQDNYTDLVTKGFRILSFAADTDDAIFKNTSFALPWKDKFCDLEGINGVNFKNYAVIGTPTMYVLDHKGKIQTKVASVQQLLEWLKKQ